MTLIVASDQGVPGPPFEPAPRAGLFTRAAVSG
jgi:hypothetical protein